VFSELKQFVPSSYCFQCKNCCSFESVQTTWRPLMANEEKLRSCLNSPVECFDNDTVDADGYVRTVDDKGRGRCAVFHDQEYVCNFYGTRPFECRIYPFMLVEKDGKPFLAAHLDCPFVHEHWRDRVFEEYVDYLTRYIEQPLIKNFISRNRQIARPYNAEDRFDFLYEINFDDTQISREFLDRRPVLTAALAETRCRLSAYFFDAIALWEPLLSFEVREIDGMQCLFATDRAGTFLYLPPLGHGDIRGVVRKVFDILNRMNASPGIARIENVSEAHLPLFTEEYRCAYKTDEYLYDREDIASYQGNAYKSKRSDYNHFVRHYPSAEFVPYAEGMAEACLRLFDLWTEQKGAIPDEARYMLEDARETHRLMLNSYEKLDFIGRVVRLEGEIIAYTFGHMISAADFCVFAEITNRGFKGLPAFIFRRFCRDIAVLPYARVNVMDAFGLPRLEKTKRSFRPAEVLAVYTVYKK
jgi:uncharacterized protein